MSGENKRDGRNGGEAHPTGSSPAGKNPKALNSPAAAWVNAPGKKQSAEERAANLGAILAAQAHWLTERLLDRQAQDFEQGGGFSERLYKARTGKTR